MTTNTYGKKIVYCILKKYFIAIYCISLFVAVSSTTSNRLFEFEPMLLLDVFLVHQVNP